VGTGAPSQAGASVGHLTGTWSAHRVVWVWVVRERWSVCLQYAGVTGRGNLPLGYKQHRGVYLRLFVCFISRRCACEL
jgi:hypothetical protein